MILFVFRVVCLGMIVPSDLACIVAEEAGHALAGCPHRTARRIVIAEFSLRCDLVLL